MPINPRVRDNNVFGTVSDNPLIAGATTFNSGGLVHLSAIITKHAVITLDPLRQYGEPEIVVITVHTTSATSATIGRGAYGTIAREHPQGTLWVHAPLNEDFISLVTSTTRPMDPYRGQVIFEQDTDKIVARSISDIWQDAVPLGAWQSYTPALTATTTNPTLGTGSVVQGKWTRQGRMITGFVTIFFGTSGATAGSGTYNVSLPVAGAVPTSLGRVIGSSYLFQTGNNPVIAVPHINPADTTKVAFIITNAALVVTNAAPWVWTNNAEIHFDFTYEAVS